MSSSKEPSNTLYPEVDLSNPDAPLLSSVSSSSSSSSSSLYPTIDMKDVAVAAENAFSDENDAISPTPEPQEQVLIRIPGAIVHLIEEHKSVELACGDLSVVSLRQGDIVIAVFARVGDQIQWPLAKDEPAVKVDGSHYFFTLRIPTMVKVDDEEGEEGEEEEEIGALNYGLTIATKGQEGLIEQLDSVLDAYSCFSVQELNRDDSCYWEVLDKTKDVSPDELTVAERRKEVAECSAAYWTTLAPNVEDYSGSVARAIAAGSGQLIRGILWCGDITVGRLKWGNQFLSERMGAGKASEISPQTLKRIKRSFYSKPCLFLDT